MSTKPGTKTTWTIHTMGGPIHRIFTTLVNAKAWARKHWTDHKLAIGPDDFDGFMSYAIRYKDSKRPSERLPWASIAERKHCETCGHVIATRSDVKGEWSPKKPDFLVPRDFEDQASEDE
jgi:hypothetical protein